MRHGIRMHLGFVFCFWVAALCLSPFGSAQAAPEIQHWRTQNGARVYFVSAMELPMVDVRVVFDAGSARDGGKPGLAQLTSALLDKGAGGLTADEIAERLEGLGARLGTGALRDMAWVSLRSLSDAAFLDPAVEIMALILGRPDFPETDFARERRRMEVALQLERQSPGAVAEKAFYRALYGDHPYASPPGGTEESLKAITRRDVAGFHKRYYVARNAVVAMVGALTRRQAEALAARITRHLAPVDAAPPLPKVAPLPGPRTVRIAHPSAQTHVYVGQPGMSRMDPDYFPLYVGNHTLGGSGLVSRLNEEIRERRGLAYSVYSYFLPMARKGPFMMGLQTRNDQAGEALGIMEDVLRRFVAEGPTEKELAASKKNITGGFPLRIDSNKKIVEYIAMIGFYGLPLDYLESFNRRVEAVTRDEIRDAFRRRLHPDRLVTVIVGGGGQDESGRGPEPEGE